jgi:hypothetical protein
MVWVRVLLWLGWLTAYSKVVVRRSFVGGAPIVCRFLFHSKVLRVCCNKEGKKAAKLPLKTVSGVRCAARSSQRGSLTLLGDTNSLR